MAKAIFVANEGAIPLGYDGWSFKVYASSDAGAIVTFSASNLPANSTFTNDGNGVGTFTYTTVAVLAAHPITFTANDGIEDFSVVHNLTVKDLEQEGDTAYPAENTAAMVQPAIPPTTGFIVYASVAGGGDGSTPETPTTYNTALTQAMVADDQAPRSVLLRRGERWSSAANTLPPGEGTASSPILISAYGEGAAPYIYDYYIDTHPRYIYFDQLNINGAFFWVGQRDEGEGAFRGVVERIRFSRCEFTGFPLAMPSGYASGASGSKVPYANQWFGGFGGGCVRDIEIDQCSFKNIANNRGYDDAIAIQADRGVHIRDCYFESIREEAIDLAGGDGHIVENNVIMLTGTTSDSGSGIKIHSQYAIAQNIVVRNNLALHLGGPYIPGTNEIGNRGTAIALQNAMGCTVEDNVFLSRWGMGLGDRDRAGEAGYYQSFIGNTIKNNIGIGGMQIEGMWNDVCDDIKIRNQFEGNYYSSWTGDNKTIRWWDADGGQSVGTQVTNASEFTTLWTPDTTNEVYFDPDDFGLYADDPFLPADTNVSIEQVPTQLAGSPGFYANPTFCGSTTAIVPPVLTL